MLTITQWIKLNFSIPKIFSKHAGTAELQQQIEAGKTEKEIKKTWGKRFKRFR